MVSGRDAAHAAVLVLLKDGAEPLGIVRGIIVNEVEDLVRVNPWVAES